MGQVIRRTIPGSKRAVGFRPVSNRLRVRRAKSIVPYCLASYSSQSHTRRHHETNLHVTVVSIYSYAWVGLRRVPGAPSAKISKNREFSGSSPGQYAYTTLGCEEAPILKIGMMRTIWTIRKESAIWQKCGSYLYHAPQERHVLCRPDGAEDDHLRSDSKNISPLPG